VRVDPPKSNGLRDLASSSVRHQRTTNRQEGDVFIRSWMIERMPRSVHLAETQYKSWVDESRYEFWLAANADAKEIERELASLGWLFLPTESVIEASAFGCDSSVLERALSRALQKAADQDITVVEIADITVDRGSCLSDASILARARDLQKAAIGDRASVEVCLSSQEFRMRVWLCDRVQQNQ